MKISDLAKKTQSSPRSIRHYEDSGLLASERSENGYRVYNKDHVELVLKIRWLLDAGLNVKTIKTILPCVQTDKKIVMCHLVKSTVISEIDRIGQQIIALKKSQKVLEQALKNGVPTEGL